MRVRMCGCVTSPSPHNWLVLGTALPSARLSCWLLAVIGFHLILTMSSNWPCLHFTRAHSEVYRVHHLLSRLQGR